MLSASVENSLPEKRFVVFFVSSMAEGLKDQRLYMYRGEPYVELNYRNQVIRVKMEDIENYC